VYEVDDVIFDSTGSRPKKWSTRRQHPATHPDDPFRPSGHPARLPLRLTAEDIGQYDVKYVGRQKVDEVDCFVFDVSRR